LPGLSILATGLHERVLTRTEHIPDGEVEVYFKAADVFVLPYTEIFQSGVLFLGYNFGLPVIAANVGSFAEDIQNGETGIIFRPKDAQDLSRAIKEFYDGELYLHLAENKKRIASLISRNHSWQEIGKRTVALYADLLGRGASKECWPGTPGQESA